MTTNLPNFDGFVTLNKTRFLPKCSGIYFVISQNKVFYIGKSINIKTRFNNHHKKDHFQKLVNPKIYWINVPKQELDATERRYIVRFKPCFNEHPRLIEMAFNTGSAIQGKFYTSQELQKYLGVSKQRISILAKQQKWSKVGKSGLYFAQDVEPYLIKRDVDLDTLPIRSYQFPDGATLAEIIEANSI